MSISIKTTEQNRNQSQLRCGHTSLILIGSSTMHPFLGKLKKIIFLAFLAGNSVLLIYSLTHHPGSPPTPDSVVCYNFATVTGKRYLVKYSDWKNIRPYHWYNDTQVPDSIFNEFLNLKKQPTEDLPTLYLPTCITASTDVYQFWDGAMNPYCPTHTNYHIFKNTKSAGNALIYMASDFIIRFQSEAEPPKIASEEVYIIRPKNEQLADIINLKKKPSPRDCEDIDEWSLRYPIPERDVQMNVFFNVPYRVSVFHQSVNQQLPVEEDLPAYSGQYLRVWANPQIADSHDLRVAITRANNQFRINRIEAHALRKGHCLLEIFNRYAHTDDIDPGCDKVWRIPEKYQNTPHAPTRRHWTFFTFNSPQRRLLPYIPLYFYS